MYIASDYIRDCQGDIKIIFDVNVGESNDYFKHNYDI